MTDFTGFHAHVYFEATTRVQAEELCQAAGAKFDLKVGRVHCKTVGPHPCWSCQLTFSTGLFGDVIPWLSQNRRGLTVFIHGETGDDYVDHTDHALWMGRMEKLNLSVFT